MACEGVNAFDAETAVIGSILTDPDSFARVSGIVQTDSFSSAVCREIFTAAAKLSAAGKRVDGFTVRDQLRAEAGSGISDDTLAQFVEVTPTAANDMEYAQIVAAHARRRGLREIAKSILDDTATPVDDLISGTAAAVDKLTQSAAAGLCRSSLDQMQDFVATLEANELGRRNVVSTGYRKLDAALGGGMLRGGLYILAARPGMGKTSLALNIAGRVDGPVLFVSLEMSGEQLSAKRVANVSGVPYHAVLTGQGLDESAYKRIAAAAAELSTSGVSVNASMGATVSQIGVMGRSIKGLSLVVVDYLGLIRPEGRAASRYEVVTAISNGLKQLALGLDAPVLALAQLNRASEARQDKRPSLADLRDSGAIEQDADGVLLLYRNDYYDKDAKRDSWTPSLVELDIAKNRHGGNGLVRFNAYLGTNRFLEI